MEGEPSSKVTLYVDRNVLVAASTSANTMIQAFTKEFAKQIEEKANELDRAANRGP